MAGIAAATPSPAGNQEGTLAHRMSVISRRPAQAVGPHTRPRYASDHAATRRAATGLLLAACVICVLALIMGASLIAYGRVQHGQTVFSGVTSTGVTLSGMTLPEATRALDQRFDRYVDAPMTFRLDDVAVTATPRELGVAYDAEATARQAYSFGRQESLWRETRHWLDALSGGHDVEPVVSIDQRAFAAFFEQHGSALALAPRDAAFVFGADGSLTIDPGAAGRAIDVAATWERFVERVSAMSSAPVEIAATTIEPTTDDPALREVLDQVEKIAGDALVLTLDGNAWEIPARDLFAMVNVDRADEDIEVLFDRAALRAYIRSLEPAVFVPGRDAGISNNGGTIAVQNAVVGHKLDIDATLEQAVAALERGDERVELQTTPVQPNITDDEVAAVKVEIEQLLDAPITLTWDGGSGTIDPQKLTRAIRFDVDPSRSPVIRYSFDPEEMRRALALVANSVAVPAKDAELRWVNGRAEVRTPEVNGRELDVQATADAIVRAIGDDVTSVAVITRDVRPPVTAETAGSVQIRERLSFASTEYGSSVPNRLHNVELAASRLNGALVPPGGMFSFNAAVGEVSFNSGYRTGYGIVGASNGTISTIPSVGGGICQVATTVFQATFHAGMPIGERNWHLYWIPRYGNGVGGMKGLDATVDADYGLDFTFKNATNDWLAVISHFDGAYLTFELWGTNPGWEIQIDQPVITNHRPANHQMVYENSDQLPAGTQVFVEHAEDGFDAAIHRVVRKDGQVVDEVTLHSTYAPARNVTLVGTG
jgi:vancomycin resistance protein YoaR